MGIEKNIKYKILQAYAKNAEEMAEELIGTNIVEKISQKTGTELN